MNNQPSVLSKYAQRLARLALATGLALALLLVILSMSTGPAVVASPSPARACGLSAPTDAYTVYLPLVMRDFSNTVYPNDPYYSSEWGLEAVQAPRAWGLSCGCSSVLVAVIDSGTDLDHPDLVDKVRTDIDYDFVNGDDCADDDLGHGTHVSGIAAAATNNQTGVAGLGWESSILPLKVLDADGYGDAGNLADAIRYAADHGAQVINMSLGGTGSCSDMWYVQNAIDYAYEQGVVLVAAAGNTGDNSNTFPANCEHVLGVAATDSSGSRAYYSTWGDHVSVAAPGSSIYNTFMGGGYGYKSGTSMATPHVAGLAALLRTRYPSYTPDQIASAILDNAQDAGAAGWDQHYGCGVIDAYEALSQGAQGAYPQCLGAQAWSTSTSGEVQAEVDFVPGEIIVAFRDGVEAEQRTLRSASSAEFLPQMGGWRLQVPPGQEQAMLAQLRADPDVVNAALNYRITTW